MKNLFKILVAIIIIFDFYVANAGVFYQVSIIKSGQGSGIVKDANLSDYAKSSDFSSDAKYANLFVYNKDDYHINCGSVCEQEYSINEKVTLIAEPDNDSFFVGWDGCAEPLGSVCIITNLKNKLTDEEKYNGKKITALFGKKTSTVPLSEIMEYSAEGSSLNNFDRKTVDKSKWQSVKDFIRKIISRIYVSLILDSKEHFMTCDELPSVDKVRQVMNEHQNILQKIEKINPGFIFVTTGDYDDCVDKSDIVISYPSHQNKLEIEKIINGKTFFEIPYRLQNQ